MRKKKGLEFEEDMVIRAKCDCQGFNGRYWRRGETAVLRAGEELPGHFEAVGPAKEVNADPNEARLADIEARLDALEAAGGKNAADGKKNSPPPGNEGGR